eukprot:g23212.t1
MEDQWQTVPTLQVSLAGEPGSLQVVVLELDQTAASGGASPVCSSNDSEHAGVEDTVLIPCSGGAAAWCRKSGTLHLLRGEDLQSFPGPEQEARNHLGEANDPEPPEITRGGLNDLSLSKSSSKLKPQEGLQGPSGDCIVAVNGISKDVPNMLKSLMNVGQLELLVIRGTTDESGSPASYIA